MTRSLLVGLRVPAVFATIVLLAQFVQPGRTFAATETYTLVKSVSQPYTCGGATPVPTPQTATGFGTHAVSAQPGQCVAINIAITNNSTDATAITGLTLGDTLPPGLNAVPGSCTPAPSGGSTCTVTGPTGSTGGSFTFTSGSSYSLPAGTTGAETFVAMVAPGTASGTVLTNTATASATGNSGATTFTSSAASDPVATVTVGAATTPGGPLTAAKYVRDVTTNTAYSSSTSAYESDVVRYEIVVTNTSTTAAAHGVFVTDTLQPGELYITGSCHPNCTFNGATVTFSAMDVGPNSPGLTNTGTFVFDVFIPRTTPNGTVITNTASVSSTDAGSATTNSTTVTVLGTTPPPCTAACYPSPCTTGCGPAPCTTSCYGCGYAPCYTGCSYGCGAPCSYGCGAPCSYGCGGPVCSYGCGATSCYYGSYCGAVTSQQTTVCGVISAYTAAGSGPGSITVNGVTYTLMPNLVPGGAAFTPGGSYCVTFYVNAAGQVAQMTVGPNVAGAYYACGVVSPYTGSYPPYTYAPYPGYGGAAGTGPYPAPGGYGGYGWNGPIMVGGYPYPVATGTTFPYQPSYGNPYCFMTNPGGYVSGCVCSIPVAAHAVEVRSGVRTGKKFSF